MIMGGKKGDSLWSHVMLPPRRETQRRTDLLDWMVSEETATAKSIPTSFFFFFLLLLLMDAPFSDRRNKISESDLLRSRLNERFER